MTEPAVQESADLILSSQRVITPDGQRPATVQARGGVIIAVGPYDPRAGRDLGRLALLPGLIDPHVHLNEPGRTDWEGFESGTAAAAAGGITTLIDMPLNSSPVTTSAAALDAKRTAADGKLSIDVMFHGGLVPGNRAALPDLLEAGVVGIKAFLCDSGLNEFPAAEPDDLLLAAPLLAAAGVPLLAHAERMHAAPSMADPTRYADYLVARPPTFEQRAVRELINLCAATGCRIHVVHLADAGCLPMLEEARAAGLPISVEACPHYLSFAAEEIPDGATQFKCAPPIRSREHREALWAGLESGAIDLIASDHSPCPSAMKHADDGRFDLAWGGMSSLQVGLPVVWTEAARRGFMLVDVVRWMCDAPAQVFGIAAGIRVGAPANLVVFDPETQWTIDANQLLHRHKATPYHGRSVRGQVVETYLRGCTAAIGIGRAQLRTAANCEEA